MAGRLPPLNALRTFECAARHLSFTKAANELNVTQAAVSHQVKALEDWLGFKLFRRAHRSLLLTDAGQSYLPVVREAFDRLSDGTRRLLARDEEGSLTVSVLPSFATKWLVPRLGRFRARHPKIDLHISAKNETVDFDREAVDLAIRLGLGHWPPLVAVAMMSEVVFPVCSPALATGAPPLRDPADLAHHTLLHDDGETNWRQWLEAACVGGVDWRRGPTFTDSSMLVQAAVDGQGVALARSAIAQDDLAAGRLVKPFEVSLSPAYAYYIVYPKPHGERPKVKAFRDWLLQEAGAARRERSA